jgi:predicted nucleic acid-binding protein
MAFAQQDRLDVLEALYGEVVVPRAVVDEVVSEPACSRVRAARWIRVEAVSEGADRRMISSRLHAGEVEVMLLALEPAPTSSSWTTTPPRRRRSSSACASRARSAC